MVGLKNCYILDNNLLLCAGIVVGIYNFNLIGIDVNFIGLEVACRSLRWMRIDLRW